MTKDNLLPMPMLTEDRWKIKVNSIIQINAGIPGWLGCLAVVTEVKSWGVYCYTQIPFKNQANVRVEWDQMNYIGEAAIVLDNEKQPKDNINK